MVEPVTLLSTMAGINILSGLAQAYVQNKSLGAQKDELDSIKRAFDAIVPPELNIDIEDPPEIIAAVEPTIDYDWTKLKPEEFKVVGTYAPEIAPHIAEQAPQLVEDTAAGVAGLEAQQNALRKLQRIADGGIDPQFAQRLREAEQASQAAAQSRQQSLLQDYARRGLLGSGTQLAAELSGAEGAMQRGAQMSADAATQAYLNQLGALRDAASLGGAIRGQELDLASQNAAIANAFNERTTAAYQKYLQDVATQRNEANLMNLRNQQGVADKNVLAANQAAVRERDRQDLLKRDVAAREAANVQAANMANQANWENRLKQGQMGRDIQQQNFANQMSKASGRSGMTPQILQNIGQQGQLQANVFSGLGKAGTQGITSYMDYKQREADRAADREMWNRIFDNNTQPFVPQGPPLK